MRTFKTALIACAAISAFGSGAYVGLQGLDSIQSARVKAIIAADKAVQVIDAAESSAVSPRK